MLNTGARYIEVTFRIEYEEGQYAAHCPELDIASCGDTFEEAASNIREAVEQHLAVLERHGERDAFLAARGVPVRAYQPGVTPSKASILVEEGAWATHSLLPV